MVPNNNSQYATINVDEVAELIKKTTYENMSPDEQDAYTLCLRKVPLIALLPSSLISGALVYKGILKFVPKPVAAVLGISTFTMTTVCFNSILQTTCKLHALKPRLALQAEQAYTRHQRTIPNTTMTRLVDPQVDDSFDAPATSSDFHETTADTFLSDESIESMIASQAETSTKEKPKYTGSYEDLLIKHRAEYASKQLSRLRAKPAEPTQPQEAELQSVDPQLSEPVLKSEFEEDEPKAKRGSRLKRNKYGDLID